MNKITQVFSGFVDRSALTVNIGDGSYPYDLNNFFENALLYLLKVIKALNMKAVRKTISTSINSLIKYVY